MERPNNIEASPVPKKEPKKGVVEHPISVRDIVILAHLKDIVRILRSEDEIPPEAVASFKNPSDLETLLTRLRPSIYDPSPKGVMYLLRECDKENCKRLWPKLAEEKEPHYHIDTRYTAKDGKEVEVVIYNFPAATFKAWKTLIASETPGQGCV